MNREYQTGMQSDVNFFIGIEVEKTPAYGLKTLFVTGIHRVISIKELIEKHHCAHIYLGANQSFQIGDNDSLISPIKWDFMIRETLKLGVPVTLDFDVKYVEYVHEGGFAENNLFIPQISVKIPYISLFNYNTTLKIDDIDFNKTNPGVWCHQLNELMPRKSFTDWREYGKDEPV